MTVLEQPNSQNLHEAIFQKLRLLLVEGKIAPGSKLNERELAESLHVSRTPIREAIRRLAADGLVELIANRGAIAVQLSLADVIHTFDVIADLEGFSGELAANNISDAALSELEALQYEMMASYARRDLSTYYKLNLRIHHLINQAANNPVLTKLFSQVNTRIEALAEDDSGKNTVLHITEFGPDHWVDMSLSDISEQLLVANDIKKVKDDAVNEAKDAAGLKDIDKK